MGCQSAAELFSNINRKRGYANSLDISEMREKLTVFNPENVRIVSQPGVIRLKSGAFNEKVVNE